MLQFPVHTVDNAPEASKDILAQAGKAFGFVPNLLGVLALAPAAAQAYFNLNAIFNSTSLSDLERQVVLLTVSRENGCDYCLAAHTAGATMAKIPPAVLNAFRAGQRLPNARLDALHRMIQAMVSKRGRLDSADIDAFLAAGYSSAQLLEIIVGIALKTISNYTNHVADTPLDAPFKQFAWTPAEPANVLCAACLSR